MRGVAAAALALTITSGARAQQEAPALDVIVRGGTVYDGTGAAGRRADVGVAAGSIVRVGDLEGLRARIEIDATGLYVTPGFINIHSHATPEGLVDARNMLAQGVTTEILNADGGGPSDVAAQLRALEERGLAIHAGANIGFNRVWSEVVGPTDRRPTAAEIERMSDRIVSGLRAGAFGISAGLDYKPGYFATAEEVISVVKGASRWRTYFSNHERLTAESGYSSRVGIAETLDIAARAGLVPIVTHMKAQGREQGTAAALIERILDAAPEGGLAAADVYPYLAGQSGLGSLIIPGWAQDGGREKMLERFRDPALRERIVAESEEAMAARFGGPKGVYALGAQKELLELMEEGGVSAGEAVVRALEQENQGAILRFGSEPDLITILRGETSSVSCDCGAVARPASHPRYWGTFPRVLGRYVREQGIMSWEEAIRKMTGLPAATIGLTDRGILAPGMVADLTVFDPETIVDHASFDDANAPPTGVRHVLVEGGLAFRDGRPTGERHGRALKRTMRMPSRPMNERGRALSVGGGEGVVAIEARQVPGSSVAEGYLRWRVGGDEVETRELGMLQTAAGWAGLTAVADVGGASVPIRILVDTAAPSGDGAGAIVLQRGDEIVFDGPLEAGRARIEQE